MQLSQDRPDYRYILQGVGPADGVLVNSKELLASFIVTPNQLIENWPPRTLEQIDESAMQQILATSPSVVLLGTGLRQRFPVPAVMAFWLTRGIGIEVMDNAAAARTFNVLAGESRQVAAAFLV